MKAVSILFFSCLLMLFAGCRTANTGTFLCNPNLSRWQGTNQAQVVSRSIMTIFPYRDRLYVSGGEWNANTGPCPIFSIDPETGAFTNEYTAGTETVWYYRPASDGSLYVPGVDIKEGSKARAPLFRRSPDGVWTNLNIVPKGSIAELGGQGYSMHTWDAICWKGKVFTAGYGIGIGPEGTTEKMKEGTPGLTDARLRYSFMDTNGQERVQQVYRRFYSFFPFEDALYCFPGALTRTNINSRLEIEQWRYNEETGVFDCATNSLDKVCPGYRLPMFSVFWHATPIRGRVLFIAGPENQRCPPGFLYSASHADGMVRSEKIDLGKRVHAVCISAYEDKVGVLAYMRNKKKIENTIWETRDGTNFQKAMVFESPYPPSAFTKHKGTYYFAIGATRFSANRVGKDSGGIYKLAPRGFWK